jgi:hypothetical protein
MNQSTIANAADGCDMGAFELKDEWLLFLPMIDPAP